MVKKLLILLLITATSISSTYIKAQEYSDEQYWENKCQVGGDKECTNYYTYKLTTVKQALEQNIKEQEEAKNNIEKQKELINIYTEQENQIKKEIDDLNIQIENLVRQINILLRRIEENEQKVKELTSAIQDKMVINQKQMHFNPILEFLMGASSFADLSKRTYIIEAISSKEKQIITELKDLIAMLNEDKNQLEISKEQLDIQKNILSLKQEEYEEKRLYCEELVKQFEEELAKLQEEAQEKIDTAASIARNLSDLSAIPSSSGFIAPVKNSTITAHVWNYPGTFQKGATHLGVDYAAGFGTALYAPINGVIIVAADECDDYMGLGDRCQPNPRPSVIGGGNQVIMIGTANNKVFGVVFFHMKKGSVIKTTGLVMQGEKIGEVGSSGNSTGPHAHIELTYLGEGGMKEIQEIYLKKTYLLNFNCGWGNNALNYTCEARNGQAPCRLDPELYLPNN